MSLCFFREIENEFTFEKCVTFRFRITKVWKRFERKYINFAVVRIRRNKISVASIRTFRRMKILRKQSFAFLLLWKRGKRNGNGIEKRFKVIRLRTGINQKNFFDTNFFSLNTKHPVIYTLNSNRYWFIIKYYEYAVPIARDATRLLHLLSLRRDTNPFSTPGYAIFIFQLSKFNVEKMVEKNCSNCSCTPLVRTRSKSYFCIA